MADIDDLVNFSLNQQPTKFASAFDEIMGQKIVTALDDMKVSVAQSMFGAEEETTPPDEEDLEVDDEELEDSDFEEEDFDDLEDYDLDDEDLDLDDEDLEGFEDDGEDA